MSRAALLRSEIGCAFKIMVRNPLSVFLMVALPALYLFVIASIFDGEVVNDVPGRTWSLSVSIIMTASVVVIGVVSATFQNLTMTLVNDREHGVLKRLRCTPLPASVFLTAQVVTAVSTATLLSVLVTGCGIAVFDVPAPGGRTAAAAVTVVVGAVCFGLLAFPFSVAIRRSSAALPMAFGTCLALFFLSGNFFPGKALPAPATHVADVFPVRHFFVAMVTALDPNTTGAGFEWGHLAVLAAWALIGAALSVVCFSWKPSGDG